VVILPVTSTLLDSSDQASLVMPGDETTDERGPETRYVLLETVRQYSMARLAGASEVDDLRDRHLAYHLGLAQAAEPRSSGEQRSRDLRGPSPATERPSLTS
jgi:predicted ATPase